MNKSAQILLSAFLLLGFISFGKCEAVQWLTNFEEASRLAKEQNKPLVLFFTGSDWCVWCKKLEAEALDTNDFDQEASSRFIFFMADFPQRARQNPTLASQNDNL